MSDRVVASQAVKVSVYAGIERLGTSRVIRANNTNSHVARRSVSTTVTSKSQYNNQVNKFVWAGICQSPIPGRRLTRPVIARVQSYNAANVTSQ